MPNPLHNPFTPEHKLPKKRLFGGDKQERQPFAHLEASEEQDIKNKLEGELFEFRGFKLNLESYTFMKALKKQMKEDQKDYLESGVRNVRWTDEEIEKIVDVVLDWSRIQDGAIHTVKVAGTRLTSLPNLPATVKQLDCSSNKIDVLPELPYGLKNLDCSCNQLRYLPDLPQALKELSCFNNNVESLPHYLKDLDELYCHNNKFSEEEKNRIIKGRNGKHLVI